MAGSPTFTIVLSSPTMNKLMQQTASIRARRVGGPAIGPARTGRGAGGSTTPEGRTGSRSVTLSDVRWVSGSGACIETPRLVLAADEYRLLATRPAPRRGPGWSWPDPAT